MATGLPWRRALPTLPILDWGREYSRQMLTGDLIAAAIVSIMLIPQSLAYALLAAQEADPEGLFQKTLKTGAEQAIQLKQHVPVHLVYFTAWPTKRTCRAHWMARKAIAPSAQTPSSSTGQSGSRLTSGPICSVAGGNGWL